MDGGGCDDVSVCIIADVLIVDGSSTGCVVAAESTSDECEVNMSESFLLLEDDSD